MLSTYEIISNRQYVVTLFSIISDRPLLKHVFSMVHPRHFHFEHSMSFCKSSMCGLIVSYTYQNILGNLSCVLTCLKCCCTFFIDENSYEQKDV